VKRVGEKFVKMDKEEKSVVFDWVPAGCEALAGAEETLTLY